MIRRRRGLPPPVERDFHKIEPDPSQIGGVAQAPFVRLPDPANLFASRARRLHSLAPDHPLGAYLSFLGHVADAQTATAARPAPEPLLQSTLKRRAQHGMPMLTADEVRGDAGFAATLAQVLDHLDSTTFPPAACNAAGAVRAMSACVRDDLATDILAGAYPSDYLAESLFLAAGLQVHLARLAQQLDPGEVTPVADAVCPVCGAAPVSSLVVGWTQASKARYCACSLCGTLWNHVRIKCTSCAATGGIVYYRIEDAPDTIGLEACNTCHTYIKHMQQHQDTRLDPLADDIASYALDVLAGDAGYHRSSINPLFLQP